MSVKKFKVIRSNWARGKISGGKSALLIDDSTCLNGKMCCLGFLCKEAGIDPIDFAGIGDFSQLDEVSTMSLPSTLVGELEDGGSTPYVTTLHNKIVRLNDDVVVSEKYREEQLTHLFAGGGITVEFVDE